MLMDTNLLFFPQIDHSSLPYVGGKGANLGELSKAGFLVPIGFCVTTFAYQTFVKTSTEMEGLLEKCNQIDPSNLEQLRKIGERIRTHLEQLEMPELLQEEITQAWQRVGTEYAYAVRSSATAEDLPTASFAGQQDTYLNIRGREELLHHIRKCWASLFTDRAIAYRANNGFDHQQVYLSVVVQRMVSPEVSGILFTADPVTGNRTITSIDASFGLGEAIVSGLVSADLYKVKADQIISKKISEKILAIVPIPEGGTKTIELSKEQQSRQVLSDEQILQLAQLGNEVERHFGSPQDIEFCVEKGEVYVVQSRPITSLYPLPDVVREPLRVLISLGHIQMMTEPMKPLGVSVFRTIFPFGKQEGATESSVVLPAGGRLYVDPTDLLRFKLARKIIPKVLSNMDEGISGALQEVIHRPEFLAVTPKSGLAKAVRQQILPIGKEVFKNVFRRDPKLARAKVEAYMTEQHDLIRSSLAGLKGVERLEKMQKYLTTSLLNIFRNLFPYVIPFILSAGQLKKLLTRWLGDDLDLQKLSQSFPGNITSEMGLDIGDLADLIRELPEVEAYLKTAKDDYFFDGLSIVNGGERFQQAFSLFLDKYGRRCSGEIDITKPRWREAPTQLIPAILGHIRSVNLGEHRQKFLCGEQGAKVAEERILQRLKGNPVKLRVIKRLINLYRYFGALREHHKYLLVTILDECKKAIMLEATELVKQGILPRKEDAFYLSLSELIQLSRGELPDDVAKLVVERKETYQFQLKLKPPRVMTSEGEIVTAVSRKGDFPLGAMIGTPVSAGIVEGKARIVLKPEEAELHEGEILIAPFTDPGWTPLFPSAKALVTEVGGLMTHGSVVAREYGIPAVVGVDDATKKIKDGQLIRVNGDQGFVEILSEVIKI
jgi:rifampicin phosphotransferase